MVWAGSKCFLSDYRHPYYSRASTGRWSLNRSDCVVSHNLPGYGARQGDRRYDYPPCESTGVDFEHQGERQRKSILRGYAFDCEINCDRQALEWRCPLIYLTQQICQV